MSLLNYTHNGEKVINVPNTITWVRGLIMTISSLVVLIWWPQLWAAIAYAVGSAWDGLDGYFARRLNQKTEFGKEFDPKVDAAAFMAGLSAMAFTAPTTHEKSILGVILILQVLYSWHSSAVWKNIPPEKKRDFWPSMVGKIKTAITMVSLVKLMWGKSFLEDLGWSKSLQDINTLLISYGVNPIEYSITQLDAALHTASLWGIGIWAAWTLWCWYSYNKKARQVLGDN